MYQGHGSSLEKRSFQETGNNLGEKMKTKYNRENEKQVR